MKFRLDFVVIALLSVALLAGSPAWARQAPDFTLSGPDGRSISLSSLRGDYVVVEFMLTTCPHCQKASKVLQKYYAENQDRLKVVGITIERNAPAAIKRFYQEHEVTYPIVIGDHAVAVNYLGITPAKPNFSVPVFFFIAPDGRIVEERNGQNVADQAWFDKLEENLEASMERFLPPRARNRPGRKPAAKSGAAQKQARQ